MSGIIFLLLYVGTLFAGHEAPQKVLARRLQHSWPCDFSLEEDDDSLAKVETRFFGPTREYSLYAEGQKLLAKAKHSLWRTATLFTVESAAETHLGIIEEYPNHFEIYDEEDQLIATSWVNFWETEILLYSPIGEIIGKLTRPFLREHDGWSLELDDPMLWKLYKAIWLLLPAIHTDRSFWQTFPIYHSQTPKPIK